MRIKERILFKLYGGINWIDRNDNKHFFYIEPKNATFKWASSQAEAERLFKRDIRNYLKRIRGSYPQKLAHIFLYEAEIEEVKRKKMAVQNN